MRVYLLSFLLGFLRGAVVFSGVTVPSSVTVTGLPGTLILIIWIELAADFERRTRPKPKVNPTFYTHGEVSKSRFLGRLCNLV